MSDEKFAKIQTKIENMEEKLIRIDRGYILGIWQKRKAIRYFPVMCKMYGFRVALGDLFRKGERGGGPSLSGIGFSISFTIDPYKKCWRHFLSKGKI